MNRKVFLSIIGLIVIAILAVGLINYEKRSNTSHSSDTSSNSNASYESNLLTSQILVPGFDSYPDSYIWAGQAIYGFPAPLENYVEILPVKTQGGDSLESWIDTKMPPDYFLPLYDKKGNLYKAFWLTRTSKNTLFLSSDFRNEFKNYLAAKTQVQEVCTTAGRKVLSWQLLSQFGAYMIVANTDHGAYGELFCPVSELLADPGGKQSSIIQTGVILDESELIAVLRSIYR